MKLHSAYLNPFQPFPEREPEIREADGCQDAIENNLSRSIFSALGNAESPAAIATFLEALAQHGSPSLTARIEALAETLRRAEPSTVEFDLQTWPENAMRKREDLEVVLIGISSSHGCIWTHDARCAPERPQPDAWVYLPGKLLLVFECKNDEHPLDATQISSYVHELSLLEPDDHVPRATAGSCLASTEDAKAVQRACASVVLDVPWKTVIEALERVHCTDAAGSLGRWLAGNAASYVRAHVYPPYRGTQTIVDWLNGPDTKDRRRHLRRLLDAMGRELLASSQRVEDAITFAKKGDDWDFAPGAGSAVYVKLKRGEQSVEIDWLGRTVHAVLWFQFTEDETQQVGLEYYLQPKGCCAAQTDANSWNAASKRHAERAQIFETSFGDWIPDAHCDARMIVSAIRFKGNKRNWHGGGAEYAGSLTSSQVTPKGALEFLQVHRSALWRFPVVESEAELSVAASQVRKPSVSLLTPLRISDFIECGEDASKLQSLLKKSVEASALTGRRDRE